MSKQKILKNPFGYMFANLWNYTRWIPVFWPIVFLVWIHNVFQHIFRKLWSTLHMVKDEFTKTSSLNQLPTAETQTMCIVIASLILKLGKFLNSWVQNNTGKIDEIIEDELPSPEGSFRTAASSPPPFDTMAPSERIEDHPRASLLGQKIRQVGAVLNSLRSVSLSSMDDKSSAAAEASSSRMSRSDSSVQSTAGESFGDDGDGASGHNSSPTPTMRDRIKQIGTAWSVLRKFTYASSGEKSVQFGSSSADKADFRLGIGRSMRAYNMFDEIRLDYQRSLQIFSEGTKEWDHALSALHKRSAKKCLQLARTNGGLYIKAAQFVASLQGGCGDKGIPREYVEELRVLTDEAPHQPFSQMEEVLRQELGSDMARFARFEEEPVAAASLAQVHRAWLDDGSEVAVKIIYPSLRKELASDLAMFRRLGTQMRPGGYDLGWLVGDFEEAIRTELDLEQEARNAARTAALLRGRSRVRIPAAVWPLCRRSVLTMEFVPGLLRLSDAPALRAAGLDPAQCGRLVSDTFAELALCHGRVHGDPHAGNVYLTALEGGGAGVVLLDHGLYHELEEGLRADLCRLYLACLARDRPEVARVAQRCAGGLGRFLPLLLSPWFVLGAALSREEVLAARDNRLPPSLTAQEVADALRGLHGEGGGLLGFLHSFGYVRGLLAALAFPEPARLRSLARFATLGLAPPEVRRRALEEGDAGLPLTWRVRLARAALDVEVTAGLLGGLTLALAPLLDCAGAPRPFVLAARATLALGRLPARLTLAAPKLRPAPAQAQATPEDPTDAPPPPAETALGKAPRTEEEGSDKGSSGSGRGGGSWTGGWGLSTLAAPPPGAPASAATPAQPRRARRLRHHSPSRAAGSAGGRMPWA